MKEADELILITGASSGIGLEMARILAKRGYNMVLVARRADKLHALKAEWEKMYNITVHVLPADLSHAENAQAAYDEIQKRGWRVTMLVNNAGVGAYGTFDKMPLEDDIRMIELNITSLVVLTKLFVRDMKAQGYGRVMNTASLVGFFPLPYFTVYAATKAFVLSFSEALRAELKGTGVSVTAFCPGTTDTGFTTNEMATSHAYSMLKPASAARVAKMGVDSLLKRRGTVIDGLGNNIMVFAQRFTPRSINLSIYKYMGMQAG